jgi:two-component sensor histidine kinase
MRGVARRLTVSQRLVAIVAVAILPSAVALPYFIASTQRERESEVRDLALRTSQIAALEMERIITGAEGILETLALAPAVQAEGPPCEAYLAEVADRLPQLRGFAVIDPRGEVHCSAGLSFSPAGVDSESWFEEALHPSDGVIVGGFTGGRPDEAAWLPVILPVRTDGRTTSIIMTGVDLEWLGARLRERNLAQGSALAVADRDGVIIAREPDPGRFVGTTLSEPFQVLLKSDRPGTLEFTSLDGTHRMIGYQPPGATGLGLYVGAGFSTDGAFGPIRSSTWRSLALAAAGALAALVLAWRLGDRLFRAPIHRILDTVASWRAGDYSARTGIAKGKGGEISRLALAIDEYMDNLAAVRAARTAAEERRTLVLREMNHRIKNILAAVQAVANQTFKDQATPESLQSFGSRLSAMAAAHDLLVAENWESVELRDTLLAAIKPFDGEHRFTLDGPPLRISSSAALSLSMALHELCTNAAKYGALSVPGGSVAISWGTESDKGTRRFRLSWTERGGPPVEEPTRRGFGSRLIRATMASEAGAETELSFEGVGVRFTPDADARRVLAEGDCVAAPAA